MEQGSWGVRRPEGRGCLVEGPRTLERRGGRGRVALRGAWCKCLSIKGECLPQPWKKMEFKGRAGSFREARSWSRGAELDRARPIFSGALDFDIRGGSTGWCTSGVGCEYREYCAMCVCVSVSVCICDIIRVHVCLHGHSKYI